MSLLDTLDDYSLRWKIIGIMLLIVALTVMNVGGVFWYVQAQQEDAEVINTAGRQRMLVQTMIVEAQRIEDGHSDRRDDLAAATDEYARGLDALTNGNDEMGVAAPPPPVADQLQVVEAEWDPFETHVRTLQEAPPTSERFQESYAYVQRRHAPLLAKTDQTVERYEDVTRQQTTWLVQFLGMILLVDVAIIFGSWWLVTTRVTAPLETMAAEAGMIAAGHHDQGITVHDREDEIGMLTHAVNTMTTQLEDSVTEMRKFREAVVHAGHAIAITDRAGTIQYVNPAFEEITGYTAAEAVGETRRIVHAPDRTESADDEQWETVLDGGVWQGDVTGRRKSGELYYVSQTISPITDDDGDVEAVVVVSSDVTEDKRRTQYLQVFQRVLRHNLRNDIQVVNGYAEALVDAPAMPIDEAVEKIKCATERLVSLSQKLQQVESTLGSTEGVGEVVPVADVLERRREVIENRFPSASITVDAPDDIFVAADVELSTALGELMENAAEHADADSPTVSVTVSPADSDGESEWFTIAVADSGPGIPAYERSVLEEGEETPLLHGSGVGLWLVYWTVDMLGGEVDIQDNQPRGTIITLRLPAVDRNDASQGSFSERPF